MSKLEIEGGADGALVVMDVRVQNGIAGGEDSRKKGFVTEARMFKGV